MTTNSTINDTECLYNIIVDLRYNLTTAEEYLYTSLEDIFFTVVHWYLYCCLSAPLVTLHLSTLSWPWKTRQLSPTPISLSSLFQICFVTLSCVSYLVNYFLSHVRFDVPYRSFAGCMLTFHSVMATYFASLFLITFVTIERYYAICKPL